MPVWRFGGTPYADQAKNFEANLMRELDSAYRMSRYGSRIFRPNGMVLNLKLLATLSAMRTVANKTVKEAPFHVAFGFEARTPGDTIRNNMIGKSSGNKGGTQKCWLVRRI